MILQELFWRCWMMSKTYLDKKWGLFLWLRANAKKERLVWDCVEFQTSLSSLSLMLAIWNFAHILTAAVYIAWWGLKVWMKKFAKWWHHTLVLYTYTHYTFCTIHTSVFVYRTLKHLFQGQDNVWQQRATWRVWWDQRNLKHKHPDPVAEEIYTTDIRLLYYRAIFADVL